MIPINKQKSNANVDFLDVEERMDKTLVEYTANYMTAQLKHSREHGCHGWWDSDSCTIEQLKEHLESAVRNGDMIDIINFSAMILFRTHMKSNNTKRIL